MRQSRTSRTSGSPLITFMFFVVQAAFQSVCFEGPPGGPEMTCATSPSTAQSQTTPVSRMPSGCRADFL